MDLKMDLEIVLDMDTSRDPRKDKDASPSRIQHGQANLWFAALELRSGSREAQGQEQCRIHSILSSRAPFL